MSSSVVRLAVSAVLRGVPLGLLWVALAGWNADYALYGVVSAAAAAGLSLVLLPPQRLPQLRRWPRRVWNGLMLAGWFAGQSAQGGVDVAVRALRRTPDIEPVTVRAPVVVAEGPARELAMLMMNLMPGSMIQRGPFPAGSTRGAGAVSPSRTGVSAQDPHQRRPQELVELHTLSPELDPAVQWRQLQQRTAAAFDAAGHGEDLTSGRGADAVGTPGRGTTSGP
ncbi:Na+/H+ antiporter subunit E [Nesterenkonia sp.]|uniref:Na+/H+ antiporter subunit E n=1 Tax=Nesterenkonia sp. TaxID=704201 RepID=UPI0026338BBA|nr:Na+/H+ antiporter subunit E [Nesterenkonia sp.]